uniref:Uncharacterized protein n=1 Tax=Oryza punctata TaxID=4537 RepID=A0A0E0JDN3_ORYPU
MALLPSQGHSRSRASIAASQWMHKHGTPTPPNVYARSTSHAVTTTTTTTAMDATTAKRKRPAASDIASADDDAPTTVDDVSDAEVEEFYAILRRMRDATRRLGAGAGAGARPPPPRAPAWRPSFSWEDFADAPPKLQQPVRG